MRVNVSDIIKIEGAGIDIAFCDDLPGLKEFDVSVKFKPPFKFSGRIVNLGSLLKLSGVLHFEYSANCVRCLCNVDSSDDIELEESFVEAASSDDSDAYTFEGNVVDIDKPLIDNMILALPMTTICREDCKGLCKPCGNNLNIKNCNCQERGIVDPRMEILKDFFK